MKRPTKQQLKKTRQLRIKQKRRAMDNFYQIMFGMPLSFNIVCPDTPGGFTRMEFKGLVTTLDMIGGRINVRVVSPQTAFREV